MKKLYPILIISLLFLLIGCSTDFDTLQDRNGIAYEANSEKPFSGRFHLEFESGKKKQKGKFRTRS